MNFFNGFLNGFANSFGYGMNVMMDGYLMSSAPADAALYSYANLDSPSGLSSPIPLINYTLNRPYMGGFTGYGLYGFPIFGFDNSAAINSLGTLGVCYLC